METLLLWEGGVTNKRLRELLSVTNVHASRIIGAYKDRYPDQIERALGTGRGNYNASPQCRPILTQGIIEEYLMQVGTQPSPAVEWLPANYSTYAPRLFGVMHQAARHQSGVAITYRSISQPAGTQRVIYPHAIVSIGQRSHVRAWDSKREAFRDFNIGRIAQFQKTNAVSPVLQADDKDWNTKATINLAAHTALSPEQKTIIQDEYMHGSSQRHIQTRACLVHYVIQDIRAAVDTERQQPPEYLLMVANREKIIQWLMP